jgi:two-component system, NarL family, vancomycin resistance associated response regulator VraR
MRVVVIENRDLHGGTLTVMLGKVPGIEIVGQSDTAGDTPALCMEHTPDIVIMDISMKDTSGLDYTAYIKRDFPDIKVFVVTGSKDDNLAQKAKEAGADIVAWRNLSMDEFEQMIRFAQKPYRVYPGIFSDDQEPS